MNRGKKAGAFFPLFLFEGEDIRMDIKIITNNQKVAERYAESFDLAMLDTDYRGVLISVRDYVHKGHKLLSHPLSGSVKPNETPYKSILISRSKGAIDAKSLSIIESAIETCDKFGENKFLLTDALKEDFMLIDFSLISGAIPLI